MIKKIAITGHSSGIGSAVMDLLDLTCNGTEIKGYSKSNGWNIADNDGDKIIQELIDFDPDVVVNNAYYPEIQTKRLGKTGKSLMPGPASRTSDLDSTQAI